MAAPDLFAQIRMLASINQRVNLNAGKHLFVGCGRPAADPVLTTRFDKWQA